MVPVLIIICLLLLGLVIYLFYIKKKIYQKASNEIFNLFLQGAYEQRINWFKTVNKYVEGRPSVFVGDSITQEFLLTEMFKGYNVSNRGIGGDTTSGVLKRLNESIFDLNPKQLFLMIGTNDIQLENATSDEIVDHIKEISMKSISKLTDLEIYLVSVFPVNPSIDPITVGIRTNQFIDEINIKLKNLAEVLNLTYIDINYILKDENNNLKPEYTREGLHISPFGYEKIIEIFKKYLIQ